MEEFIIFLRNINILTELKLFHIIVYTFLYYILLYLYVSRTLSSASVNSIWNGRFCHNDVVMLPGLKQKLKLIYMIDCGRGK